ncbi:DotU family type IV/VI secretion system protein [Pseudomonas sp. PCH199]|uniref:type VI secretion system protein TssL, short form n=1 Tax=unclassified Pseudomonas TaxID=196821 RepID=UPI000BCC248D|nr:MULTISPECIES: type VI secretion system protein TssL, short form [unclassified Pseudomonas]MCW8278225.1 DotU family type IV/VI secretion system protein [Pseudomonas sp. PCH199]PAM81532.1 type IV secretion protein DotU [Pseudomonas sp. ERMR1:02]
MNPITSKKHAATAVEIDSLLQDSYLLVVELRHGASVDDKRDFVALCIEQVQFARQQLEKAGLSARSIEHISHAQCALLDETVLGGVKDDGHAKWASEPLQARFFNRHQAGEFLYEEMREVLREPAPDLLVLTVYQRVLMLGFKGRYQDPDDPEREQLLTELSAQVAPLKLNQAIATQAGRSPRSAMLAWLGLPLAHVLTVGLLVATVWWGLDHWLGGLIATLLPDQV